MRLIVLLLFIPQILFARDFKDIEVNPGPEIQRLLRSHDKNLDDKITIDDKPGKFLLKDSAGNTHEVSGEYHLSNLLQELKLLSEEKKTLLEGDLVFQDPVTRYHRFIKDYFWKNLRRKLEFNQETQLYFSPKDRSSLKAYNLEQTDNFNVLKSPRDFADLWKGEDGLLCLGVKGSEKKKRPATYLASEKDSQSLRGMDSYFALLGLLADDEVELAFDLVKALLYEIDNYGMVLSESRRSHLMTSHPPLVSSMVRAVFDRLPKTKETRLWLKKAVELVYQDYLQHWMGEERLTNSGLSRFGGKLLNAKDYDEFDELLFQVSKGRGESASKIIAKFGKNPNAFPEIMDFISEWGCMQESGHMATHRFKVEGKDKCTSFAPVDLNAALFKTELDLAYLVKFGLRGNFSKKPEYFIEKAKKRKLLIRTFLWDEKKNLFFDYNVDIKKPSTYLAASTFYPLWAYDPTQPDLSLLSREEAMHLTKNALAELEASGGVFASSETSLKLFGNPSQNRLWDYPHGFAPHQMIIWQGLSNFGQDEALQRVLYKWLYLMTKTAMEQGGAFAKVYNLKDSNLKLAPPLKNIGLDYQYVPRQGFIWTNASYQYGLSLLSPVMRPMLEELVPYQELKD